MYSRQGTASQKWWNWEEERHSPDRILKGEQELKAEKTVYTNDVKSLEKVRHIQYQDIIKMGRLLGQSLQETEVLKCHTMMLLLFLMLSISDGPLKILNV